MSRRAETYEAEQIQVLEGLEAVRKRPEMFIGSTDADGFHHLLWEILDNSVDEALAGFATTIEVLLEPHKATVVDNGRGIPSGPHPKLKIDTLDVVFTKLHAGGKFGGGGYKVAGGLHGVGAAVTNALSAQLTVSSTRNEHTRSRTYKYGVPEGRITSSTAKKRTSGTVVEFLPDPVIFGSESFDPERVVNHLKVRAYLNPGIEFILRRGNTSQTFQSEGGLSDYLAEIISPEEVELVTDFPLVLRREESPRIDVVLTWTYGTEEDVRSFANGIRTEGGTHANGLRQGVVSGIRDVWKDLNGPKRVKLETQDIREGLVALVSVQLENPKFQNQTKNQLTNQEIKGDVEQLVRDSVRLWMLNNQAQAKKLLERITVASKARTAARNAAVVARKTVVREKSLILPGKLADCSASNPEEAELFLVEGDSAGGSAKQGRNRAIQAILPLRGKVLNTEETTLKRLLQNKELTNIIDALGCGIGKEFDPSSLRYHKIILLMDADDDGAHITTLLLTFFYRFLPQLIQDGHVFIAQPPLFRIDVGKETYWALTTREKEDLLKKLKRKKPEVTRFKGLGEMPPKVLFETTMDPNRRVLLRVEVPDDAYLATEEMLAQLMGDDPSARAEFVMTNSEDR
jgi:DNA gyrase subunit B/topoisomerase-4 subunit B